MTTNEATGTKDDSAVSPVIGVILMVAITVILAAVIGTFVLGLGEEVDSTPSAGIEVEQSPGEVQIKVVDAGNLEGLQLIGPDGVKSNIISSADALEAGVRVSITSPAGAIGKVEGPGEQVIVPTSPNAASPADAIVYACASAPSPACPMGRDFSQSNPTVGTPFEKSSPGLTAVDAASSPYNYNNFTAHTACLVEHSGFTFDPRRPGASPTRVPSRVSIPCHAPSFSQKGAGTGTTFGGSPTSPKESVPILLKEGEYKFLGVTPDGGTSLVRTVTVEEDTIG